ncbi:MAG: hypothetical protein Q9P01_09785 [Anaerolineae bacterium]|nr:hypothetical protein [Anaerolineae bacterium]MDQ7035105.1 hypothetical protein [Anaerolineae bacterium]
MRRILILFLLLMCYSSTWAQSDNFIEASVDVESPYVGQPVIYTIRVFTTRDIQNTSIVEPRFSGFGRSSFIADATVSSEVRRDVAYTVIEHSLLLYPLRVGEQTIDPLRIDIPETPFESAVSVQTASLIVNVQSLPEGAPPSFKNAVGQFDIEATVDTTSVPAGGAVILSVIVSGTGNIEQIIAPNVNFPDSWRVFPRQPITEQNTLRFASKTFQWTLLFDVEGIVEIPSVEIGFFNPQSQSYETRITAPISVTVTEGIAASVEESIVQQTAIEQSREPLPLKQSAQSFLPPIPPLFFWLLWVIPPLIVLVLWLPRRAKSRPRRERTSRVRSQRNVLKRTRDQLKAAQSAESREAYRQISIAIFDYLSLKSGIQVTDADVKEKIGHLPPKLQHLLLQCVEESASGQYAPVSKEDVNTLLRQTMKILNAVEEAWQ